MACMTNSWTVAARRAAVDDLLREQARIRPDAGRSRMRARDVRILRRGDRPKRAACRFASRRQQARWMVGRLRRRAFRRSALERRRRPPRRLERTVRLAGGRRNTEFRNRKHANTALSDADAPGLHAGLTHRRGYANMAGGAAALDRPLRRGVV